MSKHTPGPWCMESFFHGQYDVYSEVTDDFISGGTISEADARLIAAAPDLLEALEKVVSFVDAGQGTWTVEEQQKARAAIAKAKGEKQ
jgi:hypothetical protein